MRDFRMIVVPAGHAVLKRSAAEISDCLTDNGIDATEYSSKEARVGRNTALTEELYIGGRDLTIELVAYKTQAGQTRISMDIDSTRVDTQGPTFVDNLAIIIGQYMVQAIEPAYALKELQAA